MKGGSSTRRFCLILFLIAVGALGGTLAANVAGGASEHSDPCHSQHTCPSDHHTYVWTDTSTGLAWDCAEPGASEYDPSRDTTTIVYQALTYYCRSGGDNHDDRIEHDHNVRCHDRDRADDNSSDDPVHLGHSNNNNDVHHARAGLAHIILPTLRSPPARSTRRCVRPRSRRRSASPAGQRRSVRRSPSRTRSRSSRWFSTRRLDRPSDYEEDHFIPLELGGAPRNPKNLWPEPHSQSKLSDPLETQLKRKVCKGLMKLAKARATIRLFKTTQG